MRRKAFLFWVNDYLNPFMHTSYISFYFKNEITKWSKYWYKVKRCLYSVITIFSVKFRRRFSSLVSSGKWTRYWNIKPSLPCLLLQCSTLTTKHALLTFKDWLEGSCPGDICVGCKDILWGQPSVYYQHYRKEAFKLNLSNKNLKRNYPLWITNTHNLVCTDF